jgi:plasmid stabilization system protein ParE
VSLTIHLRPEAEADIDEAATWYESQLQGLGQDFLDEALKAFDRIVDNPQMYPVVHRETHRAVIHRFPFAVFYRVEEESIVVIGVTHGSRHPKRWKQRT